MATPAGLGEGDSPYHQPRQDRRKATGPLVWRLVPVPRLELESLGYCSSVRPASALFPFLLFRRRRRLLKLNRPRSKLEQLLCARQEKAPRRPFNGQTALVDWSRWVMIRAWMVKKAGTAAKHVPDGETRLEQLSGHRVLYLRPDRPSLQRKRVRRNLNSNCLLLQNCCI